jgi:hypothetical protein
MSLALKHWLCLINSFDMLGGGNFGLGWQDCTCYFKEGSHWLQVCGILLYATNHLLISAIWDIIPYKHLSHDLQPSGFLTPHLVLMNIYLPVLCANFCQGFNYWGNWVITGAWWSTFFTLSYLHFPGNQPVLILSTFYFLSSTRDWPQGILPDRHELYHLSYSVNPLSNYLYYIICLFAGSQPVLILPNIYSPCTLAGISFF